MNHTINKSDLMKLVSKKGCKKVYFIGGIDTDVGKSYVTGELARRLRERGERVITQKIIQTGCGDNMDAVSEDIVRHRHIMGIALLPEDLDHTTCPLRFSYPASPDLASRLEGREVELELLTSATERLLELYDTILLEGVGGLACPIKGLYTTLDYILDHNLPLILVTCPRLGSVSHTLMSLEICRQRGIEVVILVYNLYPEAPSEMVEDSGRLFRKYLDTHLPDCEFLEIASMEHNR